MKNNLNIEELSFENSIPHDTQLAMHRLGIHMLVLPHDMSVDRWKVRHNYPWSVPVDKQFSLV